MRHRADVSSRVSPRTAPLTAASSAAAARAGQQCLPQPDSSPESRRRRLFCPVKRVSSQLKLARSARRPSRIWSGPAGMWIAWHLTRTDVSAVRAQIQPGRRRFFSTETQFRWDGQRRRPPYLVSCLVRASRPDQVRGIGQRTSPARAPIAAPRAIHLRAFVTERPSAVRSWQPDDIRALGVTTDLPTAGEILGIGRTKSYTLAKTGQFPVPVLRVGRRYRVPVHSLVTLLGLPTITSENTVNNPPA